MNGWDLAFVIFEERNRNSKTLVRTEILYHRRNISRPFLNYTNIKRPGKGPLNRPLKFFHLIFGLVTSIYLLECFNIYKYLQPSIRLQTVYEKDVICICYSVRWRFFGTKVYCDCYPTSTVCSSVKIGSTSVDWYSPSRVYGFPFRPDEIKTTLTF